MIVTGRAPLVECWWDAGEESLADKNVAGDTEKRLLGAFLLAQSSVTNET